jgi:succinyl-diaminopimelate desuccinylase
MMDKTTLDKLCRRIDRYNTEIIRVQKELCARPALAPENGGDGELEKSEWIKTYVTETLKCDDLQEYNAPDPRVSCGYRPNMIALFKGRRSDRTLWIMTHMDVVPPGDLSKWQSDPWKVVVKDGKLIGRGVEDNQQGMTSSFMAMKAFRDVGVTPACDVGLVLVADEETGSKYGIQYLLKKHRKLFRKNDLIIIPDAGNNKGTMIEVAEKSILWLKFETRGKQTHGSTPEKGINAHRAGAHLIVRLDSLYRRYRASDALFDPPISTFEPTKKEANVPNVNTIPGEDVFYLDCRILPRYDVAKVLADVRTMAREIEKQHRVKIKISSPQDERAAPPTPADAPVVEAIALAMRQLRRRRPKAMGIGGGTVAAFFRRAGFPAAVWSTMDETAHSPNEYCVLEYLKDDAKVFAHVALQEA